MAEHDGKLPRCSAAHPEETQLGRWLSTQRRRCKLQSENASNGTAQLAPLSKDQLQALEDVVGDAILPRKELARKKWEENFLLLSAWLHKHAGRRPKKSSSHALEQRLGSWVNTQVQKMNRKRRARGRLSDDQRTRLVALFETWKQNKLLLEEEWFAECAAIWQWG